MVEKIDPIKLGLLTPFEYRVLEKYKLKTVKKIAEDEHITPSAIYGVFYRIRERRKKCQMGVNYFNALCKDRRLSTVLSLRSEPIRDEEE